MTIMHKSWSKKILPIFFSSTGNIYKPPLLIRWLAAIFAGMNNTELKGSKMHFSWIFTHLVFRNIQRIIACEVPQVPISRLIMSCRNIVEIIVEISRTQIYNWNNVFELFLLYFNFSHCFPFSSRNLGFIQNLSELKEAAISLIKECAIGRYLTNKDWVRALVFYFVFLESSTTSNSHLPNPFAFLIPYVWRRICMFLRRLVLHKNLIKT